MKNSTLQKLAFFACAVFFLNFADAQFAYVNPLPGSAFNNPETSIILRNGAFLDPESVGNTLVEVKGSVSGNHDLSIVLSTDGKTVIAYPVTKFSPGEKVTVTVSDGLRSYDGKSISGTSFGFNISMPLSEIQKRNLKEYFTTHDQGGSLLPPVTNSATNSNPDLLKHDDEQKNNHSPNNQLPKLSFVNILVNTNPTEGDLFFHTNNAVSSAHKRYAAITPDGDSLFARYSTTDGSNFNVGLNGVLSFYKQQAGVDSEQIILDSNYLKVDSIHAKNGYASTQHEFLYFPDGTKWITIWHFEPVDMSLIVPGGQTNASVNNSVIQELDANNNVIFEWKAFDHYLVTDAASDIILTAAVVDPNHLNAIYIDNDGNIIASMRHMDEITKIDINTGNIIWRWGGKNNQFTFIGDSDGGFSHQHNPHRIANGHILMFDNGNLHVPAITRPKEYLLDEANKTATLVWSFTHPQINGFNMFTKAQGNVIRLDNGNTFIGYGQVNTFGFPNATEIDNEGNIVWEMRFKDSSDYSYRMYKIDGWKSVCSRPSESQLYSDNIHASKASVHWNSATGALHYDVAYRQQGSLNWNHQLANKNATSKALKNLLPATTYEWRIRSSCKFLSPFSPYTAIQTFTTSPLRIESAEEEISAVSIFPNPGNGDVTVNLVLSTDARVEIKVVNMVGQEVFNSVQSYNEGSQNIHINLEKVPAGLYMMETNVNDQKSFQRIVIQ